MKACIACAEDIKDEAKLCKHCGTRQDDPAFLPKADSTADLESSPKKPQPSSAPSGIEYPDEYGDAAAIWNGWTLWQRRIWNEAGRPDLLTFPGKDFEQWIIDTGIEGFDFNDFVSDLDQKDVDLGSNSESQRAVETKPPTVAELASFSLLITLPSFFLMLIEPRLGDSGPQEWIGNFSASVAGWALLALIVTLLVRAVDSAPRRKLVATRLSWIFLTWLLGSFTIFLLSLVIAA